MMQIKDYVFGLPALEGASSNVLALLEVTIKQLMVSIGQEETITEQEITLIKQQFQKLINLLNSPAKIQILRDPNHRGLILKFIKQHGIEHYKYSYYNRAKVTKAHISRLEKVGPIIFSQAVMLACKINTINKNSSRNFIEDHLYTQSENPVDMKIQEILKLCDEKKRNVNNNLKKLELILDGDDYMEVVKELGKMLRDSWKKDKNKTKCQDFVKIPLKKHEQITQPGPTPTEEDQEQSLAQVDQNELDRFSFTSSQQQVIKQLREPAKFINKQEIFIYEYDESDFANKSDIFSRYNPTQFL